MNVTVDTSSPIPPYEQLRAGIAGLIAVGALAPGAPLPSVRQLATDLDLAPGTVQRAYSELQAAGGPSSATTAPRRASSSSARAASALSLIHISEPTRPY